MKKDEQIDSSAKKEDKKEEAKEKALKDDKGQPLTE